jgi:DNA-binding SARP family transcriptional activator
MLMRIHLTGTPKIEAGTATVDGGPLRTRQGRLVFAYLVCNRGRRVTRAELGEVLWPDALPRAWEASLSAVLSRLRAALSAAGVPGDVLPTGGGGGYRFAADDVWVDVEEAARGVDDADAALAAGETTRACAQAEGVAGLARGPFLPADEGPWIENRRAELRAVLVRALHIWAHAALAGQEWGVAVRVAQELIALEPFRESAYRQLMRAQAGAGNRAEALRVYERCRALMGDELGVEPSSETQACHLEILRSPSLPVPPAGAADGRLPLPPQLRRRDSTPFVGRSAQLHRLDVLLDAATAGTAQVALVTGDAGIGKTRLAVEFARAAHGRGARVLWGRCDEERTVPYQPFVQAFGQLAAQVRGEALRALVDGWEADLARLLPGLANRLGDLPAAFSSDPDTQRYRLYEGTASVVNALSRTAPLLLVVDDLHWADQSTLSLLRHLVRHPEANALVLATYRDHEVAPEHPLVAVVADLQRDELVSHLPLGRLDRAEVSVLLAERGAIAGEVLELTGGNPFFIRQLAGHLDETGAPDLASAGIPENVKDVIYRRLAMLPTSAQTALRAAAVVGHRFDVRLLAQVVGRTEDETLGDVEHAAASRVVAEIPGPVGSFAFVHDLMREAVYDQLSGSRRAWMHRRVGEAIEAMPGPPVAELARHFGAAADPAVATKAARYSVQAGAAAREQLAYREAAAHYEQALRALTLSGETDLGERARMELALGESQARAGDPAAADSFLAAAADARRAADVEVLAWAALDLAGTWRWSGAVDRLRVGLLEEALRAQGPEPTALRARLLARLAGELHERPDPERAAALSADAVAVAREAGDPATLAACLGARNAAVWGPDSFDERRKSARAIVDLAEQASMPELALPGHEWAVTAAAEHCDLPGLDRELAAYSALAAELRLPRHRWYALTRQAMRAHLVGDFDAGARLADQAVELGTRLGAPEAERLNVVNTPMWLERDAPDVRKWLEQDLQQDRGRLPADNPLLCCWTATTAALNLGWGDEARGRELLDLLPLPVVHELPRDQWWLLLLANLGWAAARLRDAERAGALLELLRPYAAQAVLCGGAVFFWGAAAHWLGVLATTTDAFADAESYLRNALDRHRRMGARPWTARTQCELARLLRTRRGPGDRDEAAELVAQARETAEGLDMRTLAADLSALG